MRDVLARCQIFEKSFELQIRRLILLQNEASSHRSRLRQAKPKANAGVQRARSVDRFPAHDEQTMTTDEGYRSGSSLDKTHQQLRTYRTISVVRIEKSRERNARPLSLSLQGQQRSRQADTIETTTDERQTVRVPFAGLSDSTEEQNHALDTFTSRSTEETSVGVLSQQALHLRYGKHVDRGTRCTECRRRDPDGQEPRTCLIHISESVQIERRLDSDIFFFLITRNRPQ